MKTFRIAKKTNEVITTEKLEYEYGILSGNNICLVVKEENGVELSVGGKIRFEKTASGNSGQMLNVCEKDAIITDIVLDGGYKYVYFEYLYINPLMVADFMDLEVSGSPYEYKFYFATQHDMVPGDFEWYAEGMTGGQEYTLYVRRGDMVLKYDGLSLCYPSEIIKGETISSADTETDCTPGEGRDFNYETMEKNAILATSVEAISNTGFTPEQGDMVILCTNPYFFTDNDDTIILYPNVEIRKYTDFMNIDIVLEDDYDAKRLYQEYQVNELFVNKIKNSIIPDFLDLEKIKYAPAFLKQQEDTGDTANTIFTPYLATGLTFNLHFRKRVMDPEAKGPGSQYLFEDVWHVNDATTEWNGNGTGDTTERTRETLYEDEDFVNSSNLIGYLGFTDDDIYNQKNRVKQTFLRLSFYDNENPLEQSLLFYSTIFMDSGDLYGKFVKKKAWLEDNVNKYDEVETPVVWWSASTEDTVPAITSQFLVNDEYDTTRSGEGFNLYLFRQDAPIENEWQDIYMKVEFNHAGYGRTVPFIFWKKGGETGSTTDEPTPLTIGNYLKNLYIKVRIMLTSEGYVYTFPDAVSADDEGRGGRKNGIVWENDRLCFNLFEPAIETEKEDSSSDEENGQNP